MLHRDRVEREYHRLYHEVGLGTTIWSPLASGVLTGKYSQGVPDDSRMSLPEYDWLRERVIDSEQGQAAVRKADRIVGVARELGITPAQLAIAWCLTNPNVSTVILGASRKDQLVENLAAQDKVGLLTPEVLETLEGILQNRPELPTQF